MANLGDVKRKFESGVQGVVADVEERVGEHLEVGGILKRQARSGGGGGKKWRRWGLEKKLGTNEYH